MKHELPKPAAEQPLLKSIENERISVNLTHEKLMKENNFSSNDN